MVRILEVKTEHVVPFKALIEVLKEILTEVIFEFKKEPIKTNSSEQKTKKKKNKKKKSAEQSESDEEIKYEGGIKVLTVNTTKTVLIYLKLDINEFSIFKCKQKLELGINLLVLYKLLKSVDKGDSLTLYFDDENKQNLGITSYSAEKQSTAEYKLKLMDLDSQELKIPTVLKYDRHILIPANEFHKMCRDVSNLAEHLEIKCTTNSIIFKCKGDNAEMEKTFKQDDEKTNINISQVTTSQDAILQGVYELKDLTLFNKCNNFCTDVEIIMKNNHPLILKYMIGSFGKAMIAVSPMELENTIYSDENNKTDSDDDFTGNINYK